MSVLLLLYLKVGYVPHQFPQAKPVHLWSTMIFFLSLCGETLATSEHQCLLQTFFWALGAAMALTWGLSAQPPHPLSAEGKNITLSFPLRVVKSHREPQSCVILNCRDHICQGAFPTGKQKCHDSLSAHACTLGCVSAMLCVVPPLPPWLWGTTEHKKEWEHLAVAATSKMLPGLRPHLLHHLEWNWVFRGCLIQWREKEVGLQVMGFKYIN